MGIIKRIMDLYSSVSHYKLYVPIYFHSPCTEIGNVIHSVSSTIKGFLIINYLPCSIVLRKGYSGLLQCILSGKEDESIGERRKIQPS